MSVIFVRSTAHVIDDGGESDLRELSNRDGEPGMVNLTPSGVREYLTCPLQHSLSTIQRRGRRDSSAAMCFGISMHAALEELHKLEPIPERADVEASLRKHWNSGGFADPRESETLFARGAAALRRYVANIGDSAARTIDTEAYLSRVVRLSGTRVRLACKVDRIARTADGSLDALDYKTNTSGNVPTADFLLCDLPTFIYYVLVRFAHPQYRRVTVSQLNVLTLARVTIEYQDADLSANKRALARVVTEITAGTFAPRPSGSCAWCSVKEHCPAHGAESDLNDLI